jgi:predicted nucleic acid-binding Zn ribbon protein
MTIYTQFVSENQLTSPVNGYTCRRITKQNIKQFGFDSVESLHEQYPDFPLICSDYRSAIGKDPNGLRKEGLLERFRSDREKEKYEYSKNKNKCSHCKEYLLYEKRNLLFCSISCANKARGPHSEETKIKISQWAIDNPRGIACNSVIPWNKNMQKPVSYCIICNSKTTGKRKTCSDICYGLFRRRNADISKKTALQMYRAKCAFKFNVYDYPEEFDLYLIEEYGWYKASNRGNNLNGISRDHIVSVRYGFDNNIDPAILAHPANCQLLPHSENSSKHSNSDITLEELYQKIKLWDEKYG